ncbi:MAG: hypothetical protein ACKVH4_03630 [Flavobacteriales bacterium]
MISITGKVISGYGVASGKGKDNRYPEGTLKLQMPFFNERGLDLSAFFIGTINIDISPYQFSIKKYKYYFKEINWSIYIPPENFYFFEVQLIFKESAYEGLIYMPDPKTKFDHHQISSLFELLMPKIEGIKQGENIILKLREGDFKFTIKSP